MVNMVKVIGKHDFRLKTALYKAFKGLLKPKVDISITKNTPQVKTTTSYKVISPMKRFNQLQAINSLQNDRGN